jgi:hypothetical protein
MDLNGVPCPFCARMIDEHSEHADDCVITEARNLLKPAKRLAA